MNKTLIYSIITTDKEASSIRIPRYSAEDLSADVVLVDNRDTSQILNSTAQGFPVHKNQQKLSLAENLQIIVEKYNYASYLRIDPDDIIDEGSLASLIETAQQSMHQCLVTSCYQVITNNRPAFNLNRCNGLGSKYELLGAGIVVPRHLLRMATTYLSDVRGQDNFAIWLLARRLRVNVLYADATYQYSQDHTAGMSRQTQRILDERNILIDSIFYKTSSLTIAYITGNYLKRFKLSMNCNIFIIQAGCFFFLLRIGLVFRPSLFLRRISVESDHIGLLPFSVILSAIKFSAMQPYSQVKLVLIEFDRSFKSYIQRLRNGSDNANIVLAGILPPR